MVKIPKRQSTISPKRRNPPAKPRRRHYHGWSDHTRERRELDRARWAKTPPPKDDPKITSAKQRAMDKGLHGDRGKP